jgi:hypothetical protein
MSLSNAVGINMPDDFNTAAHNAVVERISPHRPSNPAVWSELASGWNAVAIRFKSMANADERYTASIRSKGAFGSSDERVIQEEALFAFFMNGFSTIDSFGYAAFGMGAMLRPSDFPMTTPASLRAINLTLARSRFSINFPGSAIEGTLSTLISDPQLAQWGSIRHVLVHRSAPPRHHHVTVGANAPDKTDWEIAGGRSINDQTTAIARLWLATTLRDCLLAAETFVTATFT